MLVVDSSVFVAHLRGDTKATTFLAREAKRGPVIAPALVAWELWKGATTPAREDKVRLLLESVEVDAWTPAMAELAGRIHRDHRARGVERPAIDILIASHALHRGAP